MSSSVDNTTRHTAHPTVAKGEEAIAESHRMAGSTINNTDRVVSAPAQTKLVFDLSLAIDDQPYLPKPDGTSKVYQGGSDKDESLIALMGALMLLQAHQDGNKWKAAWEMASMNMEMEVELAPLAGKAVQAQFTAQSAATMLESARTWANGSMLGMSALGSVGKGIYDVYKNPKSTPKDPAVAYSQEGKNPPSVKPPISDKENQELEKNDSWDFGKTWDFMKTTAPKLKLWAYDAIENAADFSKKAQGFSKIMIDATDAKFHSQQQSLQGIQRMAASTGQGIQAYAKFFGETFSKEHELGQACRQNLTSALRLMEQATNTISQSATAMFRG